MLTEDYLIRRINQVIALLLHAVGLRKDGQMAAALTDIDIALELMLGMRSVLLKEMDDSSLLQLLTVRGRVDIERLTLVAGLYQEEAAIFELEGRLADSLRDRLRALNFWLVIALDERGGLSADQMMQVEQLRAQIPPERLPVDILAALLDYTQRLLELEDARLAEAHLERSALQAALNDILARLRQS